YFAHIITLVLFWIDSGEREHSPLCPAESEGFEVTGLVGRLVEFKCSHIFAKRNKKYFCKDTCTGSDILVQTEDSKNCIKTGRYSIDDRGDGDFTVTINHLKTSDSGTYWCGVDRFFIDSSQEVLLTVQDGMCFMLLYLQRNCMPPFCFSSVLEVYCL
uniref:Immunoglobulin domain-containing protein n=1 Tax=Hucho hucho TaxID=62062 RepID=A0A4W5PV98_9TELE